ncbi:DUF5723 family protein [Melioribacter sp. OK-6-Me]|uniref:DUF5723 family protein n=1 Tax=unclassified Melioribacter TaxID=2627329 RepID=UPI003EDAB304
MIHCSKYIIPIIILFGTASIKAQISGSIGMPDAKSSSMAGSYSAISEGLYSVGINPANLSLSKGTELIIPLPFPSFSSLAGSNFFSLSDYNYYFGSYTIDQDGKKQGRYLNEADKENFIELFSKGGGIQLNLFVRYFALSFTPSEKFGTLAFSMSDQIAAGGKIPAGLVELLFKGNPLDSRYNFNDTEFKAWWLRKYSLSYSKKFEMSAQKSISAGLSLNLINGLFYAGLDEIDSEFHTDSLGRIHGSLIYNAKSAFSPNFGIEYDFENRSSSEENISLFPEPAGRGYGIDFGISYEHNQTFTFAFAITDIGRIEWNKRTAQFNVNRRVDLEDISEEAQRDSLESFFSTDGSGKPADKFFTKLATVIRFGASIDLSNLFDLKNKLLISGDYVQGLNTMPANSTSPRISIGIEWLPFNSFLSLRSGMAFGGWTKFLWGFGLGFDFGLFEINAGTSNFQNVTSPSYGKMISVAIDSRWKF